MANDALDKIAATAPDHIWLDLGEEAHLVEDGTTFKDLGGVTWSEDNATGQGIKYVRATPTAATPAAPGEVTGLLELAKTCGAYLNGSNPGAAIVFRPDELAAFAAALSNPAPVAAPAPDGDDSFLLCVSDLQHSAIYDSPKEMHACIRAVAERIKALAAPAPASEAVAPIEYLRAVGDGTHELVGKHERGAFPVYATPTPGDSADAPVQQAGEVWADGTLLEPLSEDEVFQCMKSVGPRNSRIVRVLARYWKTHPARAALKGEQPAQPSGGERGEV